eukprot:5079268-Karenia_brevis.AAC.1
MRSRSAIVDALQMGCKKHNNVFLYGPNTSGKSHVLKPLAEIFKDHVFLRPVGRGNYPLQSIFGKKVCVLQDVRINTFKLSWDSLLVWFEGESFPVPLPRNRFDEDKMYDERAPVFVSSGAKFVISQAEAQELCVNPYEQNDMMDARFRFFHFPCTLTKAQKKEVKACHRCFAEWILRDTAPQLPQMPVQGQPSSSSSVAQPGAGAQSEMAIDAIMDWIETHGGELRLTGPTANICQLSDSVSWSTRFLAANGRLLPFVRRFGVTGCDQDVIVGMKSMNIAS